MSISWIPAVRFVEELQHPELPPLPPRRVRILRPLRFEGEVLVPDQVILLPGEFAHDLIRSRGAAPLAEDSP